MPPPHAPDYRQPSAPEADQEGEEPKTTSPDPLDLFAALAPPNSEVDLETTQGLCISSDSQTIEFPGSLPQMFVEWMSGRATYPRDDLEASTRRVWEWLNKYAHQTSKSKEDIAVAVDVDHVNVAAIVDALVAQQLVVVDQSDRGHFSANNVDTAQGEEAIRRIARDPSMQFRWRGYECRYRLEYRYVTEKDRLEFERQRQEQVESKRKTDLALKLAIASLAVGLISGLITLLTTLFG